MKTSVTSAAQWMSEAKGFEEWHMLGTTPRTECTKSREGLWPLFGNFRNEMFQCMILFHELRVCVGKGVSRGSGGIWSRQRDMETWTWTGIDSAGTKCNHFFQMRPFFFHDCHWAGLNTVLRDDGLDVDQYGLKQLNAFQDEKFPYGMVFGLVNFHFGRGDLVDFLQRGDKPSPKHCGKDMTFSLCKLLYWTHTLEDAGKIRIAANDLQ